MTQAMQDHQKTIYDEMLSHPALFTHAKAQKIAIIGENNQGIIQEALKHSFIKEIWQSNKTVNDDRIHTLTGALESNTFDIIVLTNPTEALSHYHTALKEDGILLYLSSSPFDLAKLKNEHQSLHDLGFFDIHLLSFPQPNYPTGWRTAFMAIKNTAFKRLREQDIYNKSFATQYYNFDIHKAAMVLPEFMRAELSL